MNDCECLAGCPFFNDRMSNKPATAELFKTRYCRDQYSSCARYMIFKVRGKAAVPADLFPNEADRAKQILGKS